jgi:glycosyltransferase involved in cell wall biosynthesis
MARDRATCSIAMCTYNGAHHLPRQLQSLADQTLRPSELVVTDDGSRDGSLAVLHDFADCAPFPVRVVRNEEKLGYRENFMKAAGLTQGDLVFFCDQDDVWEPSKVERMAENLGQEGTLLVYHNARLVGPDERPLSALYHGSQQSEILAEQPIPPWHFSLGFTQAFRRELLEFQDLWPSSRDHMTGEPMAHDQWFFMLAAFFGGLEFLDEELVLHRQHSNNLYGVRGTSRWRRLASRFSHHAPWDALAADAAESRSAVIGMVGDRRPNFRTRAQDVQRAYRSTAERHRRRYRAYSDTSIASRLGAFGHALANADYRGRPWGLEPLAMPRDFVLGVLAGTGIQPPGPSR